MQTPKDYHLLSKIIKMYCYNKIPVFAGILIAISFFCCLYKGHSINMVKYCLRC